MLILLFQFLTNRIQLQLATATEKYAICIVSPIMMCNSHLNMKELHVMFAASGRKCLSCHRISEQTDVNNFHENLFHLNFAVGQ